MRRRDLAAVMVAVIGLVLLGPTLADARHHPRCGQPHRDTRAIRERTIRCWARDRGIDAPRTIRLVICEVGTDLRDGDPGRDTYEGSFQQDRATWRPRARLFKAVGPKGRPMPIENTWAQAKVSTGQLAQVGFESGLWPTCGPRSRL